MLHCGPGDLLVQGAPVWLPGEVAPDEARVHLREEMRQRETDVRRSSHLEVSAPDSGAGQALVQGQQVQAVGVGAALDLVTGARLESDNVSE